MSSGRVDWAAKADELAGDFPLVATPGFGAKLAPELMGSILRDCLRLQAVSRRGRDSMPEFGEGVDQLTAMFGLAYDVRPFMAAFRELAGGAANNTVARKVGISKDRVQRLRSGKAMPTMAELETIATAYGRQPTWFADYRRMLILSAVSQAMSENPERSAVWIQQMGLR